MILMPPPPAHYRPCVGIVIFNPKGQVWSGKRMGQDDPYAWQFPQGGIDPGETPKMAARRELYEETGIGPDMINDLGEIDDWLTYDFPPDYVGKQTMRGWRGQAQKWFAFDFAGEEIAFNLRAHPPQEFSEWRWDKLEHAPEQIVPFKRDVYERVTNAFKGFAHPKN